MKSIIVVLLLGLVAGSLAANTAHAKIFGFNSFPTIVGDAWFVDLGDGNVTITVNAINVPNDGLHGIHIHWWGDILPSDANFLGGHYNPYGNPHGCETDSVRHLGDLGNWNVSGGVISESKTVSWIGFTGVYSIIGRAIVIHAAKDNCTEVTSAGGRLAAGVIGIVNGGAAVNSAFNDSTVAIAHIRNTTNHYIGYVYFQKSATGTDIFGYFTNLVGVHGLHIHQYGELNTTGFASLGGHWSNGTLPHGIPPVANRHLGDLGNIYAFDNSSGVPVYKYLGNEYVPIEAIVGRGIIIHANPDPCQPADFGGARYAAGVIGIRNPAANYPYSFANVPALQDTSACTATPVPSGTGATAAPTTAAATDPVTTAAATTLPTSTPTAGSSKSNAGQIEIFASFVILAIACFFF